MQAVGAPLSWPLISDPTGVHRRLRRTTVGYTFFSNSHGTLINTDHIPDNKTHLNTFKIRECAEATIVLETNSRKMAGNVQIFGD